MENYQEFISTIKDMSSNYILSCELSLYLLDLQRNYANYIYNRDNEMDNLESGIYQLKKRRLSRKYKKIENYIWICYIYLYIKNNDYNVSEIEKETLKKIEKKIQTIIYQDLKSQIIDIYGEEVLKQSDLALDTIMSATCLYMSCQLPNHVHFKNLKYLINEIFIKSENQRCGNLRKKFKDKTFCSCFVKVNSTGLDCFVFSGGWDNEVYPNCLTRYLSTMIKFIWGAANAVFKRDMTWCIRKENMRSYNFRCNAKKYAKLGEIFQKFDIERSNCINIHFSCCERKVLSYFEGEENVDLEIYVTFEPCSNCELALNEFLEENKGSKIKVIYNQKKVMLSHKNNCDLYKVGKL